ncbi:hypothetical protein [Nocardia sp. NPDC057455]|uniref:hypothetical protein n=1 Tax=Nocardia sp. NPDC057455 TaxID=3346138 RepID=UPI0036719B6D
MPDEPANGSSEIAALAQQVETARGKLPLQLDPALLEVLSEREITAERELAEWIRAQRRKQRRREIEAELAVEQRDRKSAVVLRRSEEADARWHRRALAARRRASSEDARLAQLYRRAEWSSRALIAVVVLGMVWAGVNVQHNLVPSGDMSDPLYWLSYGIEAMISIPIITIMVAATTAARWGRELARGKVIFFEAALLGTTVALNTGPHLAAGDLGRAAEYAIAPVMVGVVIWLHAWVAARYAVLIDGAPVIERDRQTIRVDAQRTPGTPEAGGFHTLGQAANSGRFPREGEAYAARVTDGREASSGTRGHLDGVHHSEHETTAHRTVPTATTDTRPAARLDECSAAAATMPGPARIDHGKSSPNGHAVGSPINGHPVTIDRTPSATADPGIGEVREHSTTSGPADKRVNGHAGEPDPAFPHASNGHPVETIVNGHTHGLTVNGHTLLSIDGKTNRAAANGNAYPHINGNTAHPAINGHTVEIPDAGAVQPSRVDEKTARPSTNGHAAEMPNGIQAHALPVEGHTAPGDHPDTLAVEENPNQPVAGSEVAIPAPHAISPTAQHVPEIRADDHRTRPGRTEAAQPSPAEFEQGTPRPDEAPGSETPQPRLEFAQSAAQQFSLADLNDGLEFDERSSTSANSAASAHAPATRGERPVDRVHRGDDAARRPGSTDPKRTPSPATADTAAQVHPTATAPRAAKRGKSVSAEQNDRSADAESEQLALEEAPELPHPRVDPMPIVEDNDEDDEFPTEPDEADTDDDEISAIARAITGRRLSSLPIEEVREILTLADQGGSTPAIANELGLARSAVTRVLDSAIKVHRPYATIG